MRINPETAKNTRTSIIFLSLTAAMFFLIFKFGLSSAVKISQFIQRNNSASEETPLDSYLSAPQFASIVTATNSAQLPIEGYAPANKEVAVSLNGVETLSLAVDSEGKFSGILDLALGVNELYAITRDFENNTSAKTEILSIFYSDTPPNVEITEPAQDSVIKNNSNIVLKGKTDINSKVYINDHQVLVESNGLFVYQTKLTKGENIFKIKVIDPANNLTEKEFKLQFRP